MNIRELMNENLIELGAELYSKNEALERLIRLQKTAGAIRDPRALRREIDARERQGTGAVSCRIAVTGVMHSGAKHTAVSAVTLHDGVDFNAPDRRPVRLIFMIAGKSGSDEHTAVREKLLRLLSDPEFSARLCAAKSKEEFLTLIGEREKMKCQKPMLKRIVHQRFS